MASEDKNLRLLIIDTDAGIDDAEAILLALSYRDEWKILAITCGHGNTHVDNVCVNVMKILVAANSTEIPVHRGCDQSLLWKCPPRTFHGKDGLGDVGNQFSTGSLKVSDVHAVNVLSQLAKRYPGEITLLSLGPLTNLAIAHRIDPEFTKNLKSMVLMGGNITGEGNITPAAEFNFHCDPESAHIILTEASCPILMVPWETTVNHAMDWDVCRQRVDINTPKGQLLQMITAYRSNNLQERKFTRYLDCDVLAATAVLCPLSVVETIHYPVSVETRGMYTRGQSVIERFLHVEDKDIEKNDIKIVTKFNDELLNEQRFRLFK